MNNHAISSIRSTTAIFWLGFFMAISFMEAPLKFTAPGISLAQGLSIGSVVYTYLNKLEWVLFLVILATSFFHKPKTIVMVLIAATGVILTLETAWLLPFLDKRAHKIMLGQTPSPSNMHLVYILMEILKVPLLFVIGWQGIKKK